MSKFKVGTRVVVIDEKHELRKGTIDTVYLDMEIAIVKFDDGNTEKVHFSNLGIEPETKAQEEKATEPVEKSEITITPEEFQKISIDVITEEVTKMGQNGKLLEIIITILVAKIHGALFIDAVDND